MSPESLAQSISSQMVEKSHAMELSVNSNSWTEAARLAADMAELGYRMACQIEELSPSSSEVAFEGIAGAFLSRKKVLDIRSKEAEQTKKQAALTASGPTK